MPPSEEIFLNPATSNTTGPLRDAMDGSSGLDEVELFSSDTMDSPSDFEDSKPSASSADRLPKLQSPIIVRHPPSSNSFHDALVVSPDLEDTMPDSFDMDSSKPNLPTTYSNRNLDANFFATFEKHRGPSRIRREARALLSEAISYVARFPKPQIFEPDVLSGGSKLKQWEWECSSCTAINSHRPVNDCIVCRQNPSRSCQIKSTLLVYTPHDFTSELFDESDNSDDSADELNGTDGQLDSETTRTKLALIQSMSEHKYVAQTNFRINLEWIAAEAKLFKKNRYSVCLPPIDFDASFQRLALSVDLSKPDLMSQVLRTPYAIQKPIRTHLVLAHSLHNTAHLVIGDYGLAKIAELVQKKPQIFGNQEDHLFDPTNPHLPVVLNTDEIMGVSESTLRRELFRQTTVPLIRGFATIMPLRKQVALEMESGLKKFGDEIVSLGKMDGRRTWCFHAGITPIQGKAWKRPGGFGIARPGLMDGKVKVASDGLRRFSARLGYLLTHVFIARVLSGTCREQQGYPSKIRRRLAANWYVWLKANPSSNIRLPDAITFSIGNGAIIHFDSLNDPRFLFDHITWAVIYVGQLSAYLSIDSLKELSDAGVETSNVAFTHLSYPRAIMGHSSDRIEHLANIHCPLFKSISCMLNDDSFRLHDTYHLRATESRMRFLKELEDGKEIDCNHDYKCYYMTREETMTRDILLGSLYHLWMLFLHSYGSLVTYGHLVQFVVFVGRNVQTPTSIYQVMSEFISWRRTGSEKVILETLAQRGNVGLYVLLLKSVHKRKTTVSQTKSNLQGQPSDHFVVASDGDQLRAEFLMKFVGGCLETIKRSVSETEVTAAINLLGCAEEKRKAGYSLEERSVLQYGSHLTTFTIQVASFFGVIGPQHGSYSEIEKGVSDYYGCVNSHLEESLGHPLSTEEARFAVDGVISKLLSSGHHVDKALTDQVCCYWHRSKTDTLNKNVFFWDHHNHKLMNFYRRKRYKKGTKHRIEIFHKENWRSISDYVVPFHKLKNLSPQTNYVFLDTNNRTTAKWVRDLPGGSLHHDILS